MGFDGYKGPDINEKNSGKKDIPQSFESENIKKDSKSNNLKDDLNNLKEKKINSDIQSDIQLDNKIEEILDTYVDLSGKQLSEQDKGKFKKLLLESSKKSEKPKLFLDKVISYLKQYGSEVTLEDFEEIITLVSQEHEVKGDKQEIRGDKQEIKGDKQEITGEEQDTNLEEQEKKKKKNNLTDLKKSLSGLEEKNNNYGTIIENINILLSPDGYSEKLYLEIINQLKTDNAFEHIATDLQEKDKKNGTNNYGEFKKTLLKIDKSGFNGIIERFEAKLIPAKQKIVLGKENIYGVDIGKNVLRIRDNDGSITEAGKDGRKLSLAGSDYKLDSKINNGGALREISSIEEEFKKEMEEINRELDTLIAIMEYVDDAIANNVELSVVKQTIKSENVDLYNKMNLDSLKSLEQVKNSFVVMIKQKEEEKEKKIKEKKGIIDEIIRQNALSAKEIDEKKKEILKFLHQIKFDLLPKDLTDQILNEFKSNVFGIPGLDLNKDTIDLTNGKFGEGVSETGGDRWKDNLVKFMEKMIYGQIGTKESIFSGKQFKGELGANIDPLVINTALEQNGLKTEFGWNINIISLCLSSIA